MKRKDSHASIKRLTVSAILVALGVIFLGIGAIVDVLDVSMAVIASLSVIIAIIEYGKGTPWMVYAAISVLSFLLLPSKLPSIFFALFFGFYPILKEKLERKNPIIRWVLKEIIFNICLVAIMLIYFLLFFQGLNLNVPLSLPWVIVIAVILCEGIFILYDIALTKMIVFYVIKLRNRLKLK